MKNKQRGFVGIFIVIIILMLISFGIYLYYINQSKSTKEIVNTDNWQTYKSNKYNFEFKYPSDEYKLMAGDGSVIDNTNPDLDLRNFILVKEGASIPFVIFSKKLNSDKGFLDTYNQCGTKKNEVKNVDNIEINFYSGKNCAGYKVMNAVVVELENDYLYSYVFDDLNTSVFNTFKFTNKKESSSDYVFPAIMNEPDNVILKDEAETKDVIDNNLRINSTYGYKFKILDGWSFDYEDSVFFDALIKNWADQKQNIDLGSDLLGNPQGVYIGKSEEEYLKKVKEHANGWDFKTTNAFTLKNLKNPNIKIRIFLDNHDLSGYNKSKDGKKITQLNLSTPGLHYIIKIINLGNNESLTYFGKKPNVINFRFNPDEVSVESVNEIVKTFETIDLNKYFFDKIAEQVYVQKNVPKMGFSIKLKPIFDAYYKPEVQTMESENGIKTKYINYGISLNKYEGINYKNTKLFDFSNPTLSIYFEDKNCSNLYSNFSKSGILSTGDTMINGVKFKVFNGNPVAKIGSSLDDKTFTVDNKTGSLYLVTDKNNGCYYINTSFMPEDGIDASKIQKLLFEDVLRTFKFI